VADIFISNTTSNRDGALWSANELVPSTEGSAHVTAEALAALGRVDEGAARPTQYGLDPPSAQPAGQPTGTTA
jgi:hypothetical protein